MATWKFTKVDAHRDLWTKGEFTPGVGYPHWIHIDKIYSDFQLEKGHKYEVGASTKINPDTHNGHFRYYKTYAQALSFVKKYMRTH